ncbi:hypothetical protein HDE_05814 [Halotydeus destructor]|nr:hypothetical protein HDE_05814 [Halotydeus destructor]
MSATGRKNRDPNFTQEQLDYLNQAVQEQSTSLFGKDITKEEKEVLWEEIAEKVNDLDPKHFKRSGPQVKRKYIKYQSEIRIKAKQKETLPNASSSENNMAADSITVHQSDMNGQTQTSQMSFVDIIGVIPDVSNGQDGLHDEHRLNHSEPITLNLNQLEPVRTYENHAHNKRQEEFQRENIALQKVGLFMKMKKYQRMGHLTPTDVRLITRWIKSPSSLPFKSK